MFMVIPLWVNALFRNNQIDGAIGRFLRQCIRYKGIVTQSHGHSVIMLQKAVVIPAAVPKATSAAVEAPAGHETQRTGKIIRCGRKIRERRGNAKHPRHKIMQAVNPVKPHHTAGFAPGDAYGLSLRKRHVQDRPGVHLRFDRHIAEKDRCRLKSRMREDSFGDRRVPRRCLLRPHFPAQLTVVLPLRAF